MKLMTNFSVFPDPMLSYLILLKKSLALPHKPLTLVIYLQFVLFCLLATPSRLQDISTRYTEHHAILLLLQASLGHWPFIRPRNHRF